jgi:hypothetical protein
MEHQSHSDWLEARAAHREFLFGKKAELIPKLGDIATESMVAIAYSTNLTDVSDAERLALIDLREATYNILEYHNSLAENNGGALFAIIDADDLDYIAALTAEVICRWERSCERNGLESPFSELVTTDICEDDFKQRDVQLVIETAASVIELANLGFGGRRDIDSPSCKRIMNLIVNRGPLFALEWIKGDIIRDSAHEYDYDATEISSFFSRAELVALAKSHMTDPLAVAARQVELFKNVLSEENLASELDWEEAKVARIFPPSKRKRLARTWSRNPLKKAKSMAYHIDNTLSTQNVASLLGESETYVDELFYLDDRKKLAELEDPTDRIRDIAQKFEAFTPDNLSGILGWTNMEVEELFTPYFRSRLAYKAGDPEKIARKVAHTFKDKLSVESIASVLGWSLESTSTLFTTKLRREICLGNSTSNVIKKVRGIVAVRNDLIQNYQLPIEIINYISNKNGQAAAFLTAETILEQRSSCPPGVEEIWWMWAIASKPTADEQTWSRQVMGYLAFSRRLIMSSGLQDWQADKAVFSKYTGDEIMEDFLSDEPGDFLQELAEKAGVDYGDLHHLMSVLGEDENNLSMEDKNILGTLRSAVSIKD